MTDNMFNEIFDKENSTMAKVVGKEITDLTAQQVASKFKMAFRRIKGVWEDKNKEIKKIEKKLEKLNEENFILKEEREGLESELEGIRTTFESYCKQTGITYELGE
jgi:hypothetical protein